MKKITAFWRIVLVLTAVILVGVGLSFVTPFCDWYALHVYAHIADGLGWLTAGIPFPLGEILLYIGVLLVLLCLIFLILLPFRRRREGCRRFAKGWYKAMLMTFTVVLTLYVTNWLIPFRGSVLGQNVRTDKSYSFDEVYTFREYVYKGVNEAAELVPTDENGHIIFPDETQRTALMIGAMQAMASEYPLLSGYYPPVKTSLCSDLLDRMGIGGFTYPYTTEATHVRYSLSPVYQPVLDAHELSHHKGYYKENEADFLALLALSRSDDPFIRFCGFWEMTYKADLVYSEAAAPLIDRMIESGELPRREDGIKAFVSALTKKLPVTEVSEKAWQIVDESSGVLEEMVENDIRPLDDMPNVETVVQDVADVGWETQAEVLGENVYDGAAALLLVYFDGKLYESDN